LKYNSGIKDSIEFQLKKLLEVGDGDFVNTYLYRLKPNTDDAKETTIKSSPRVEKAMTGLEKTSTSVCRSLVDFEKKMPAYYSFAVLLILNTLERNCVGNHFAVGFLSVRLIRNVLLS